MLSILEIPSIRRQAKPIDLRTYHWMGEHGLVEEKTELLRGVIVEKMSKSPLHSYLINRLLHLLQQALPNDFVTRKEDPLSLHNSEPEPDLAVVAQAPHGYRHEHPATAALVIEVAVSTEETDREKVSIYSEAGIPETWLVLPESECIELFSVPQAGRYTAHTLCGLGDIARSTQFPQFQVALADLLADRAVYK